MKILFLAFVCVAFMLDFTKATNEDCPTIPWTDSYKPGNKYEYIIQYGVDSYQDAKNQCEQVGGALSWLGPRFASTYDDLWENLLKGNRGDIYIDLTDIEQEGQFVWGNDDPIEIAWSNWNDGEPNNIQVVKEGVRETQNCVVIRRDGKWDDILCSYRPDGGVRDALCERKAED